MDKIDQEGDRRANMQIADDDLVLSGESVQLRPVGVEEAESLAEFLRDDGQLRRDLGIRAPDRPEGSEVLAKVKRWCEQTNSVSAAVVVPNQGVVGLISLSHVNAKERSARIGYWTASSYRGRGYTKEAFCLMLQLARREGIRTVSAKIDKANLSSLRIWRHYGAAEQEVADGKIECRLDLSPAEGG